MPERSGASAAPAASRSRQPARSVSLSPSAAAFAQPTTLPRRADATPLGRPGALGPGAAWPAAPGPAAGSGGAGTPGDDGVGGPVTGLGDASGDADATLVDRDGAKTGGLTIHTGVAGVPATGNGVARCWIAVSHSKLAWASAARASAPSRRVHRLRLRGGA